MSAPAIDFTSLADTRLVHGSDLEVREKLPPGSTGRLPLEATS